MAGGPGDIVVPFMGDSVPDGVIAAILKMVVDEIVAQIETDKVCDTGLYALQCCVLSSLWLPPNELHVLQRYLDFLCRTTV
jgi:pyruvate/2-oxoglutarate dehydrogenase complex dihydrolipoamide acyltransferase (E2) component